MAKLDISKESIPEKKDLDHAIKRLNKDITILTELSSPDWDPALLKKVVTFLEQVKTKVK